MSNMSLYTEVKNIINDNYIFLGDQREKWLEGLKEIENYSDDIRNKTYILDRMLKILEDPHTKLYKNDCIDEIYDINCLWVKNKIIVMPNIFGYENDIVGGEIIEINNNTIDDIIINFKKSLKGFPESIIKEEFIHQIKKGLLFDKINIKIKKNNSELKEEIKKASMNKIRRSFSSELKEIQSKNEPILIKEIDDNILLIKIFSFRIKGIVDHILNKSDLIKNNKTLIFDIRENRGGFIEETKRLVSIIISKDVELDYKIMSRHGLNSEYEKVMQNHNEIFSDKNIFIVCDEYTMSSAEFIFIRSLKNGYKNVKIVGRCTAGMSGQAKIFKLSSGDILQVTVKKYINKYNKEIKEGYIPDIIIDPKVEDFVNGKDKELEMIKSICRKRIDIRRIV